MMDEGMSNGLDLDTATTVLCDVHNTLVPWMHLAVTLQNYLATKPAATGAVTSLLKTVQAHIAHCSDRINKRIEKDTYRGC